MPSGIYLIGEKAELQTYEQFVEPFLREQNILTPNRTIVPINTGHSFFYNTLLVSLQGGDLEKALNLSLVQGFKKALEGVQGDEKSSLEATWEYTAKLVCSHFTEPPDLSTSPPKKGKKEYKGCFKTIGAYEDDEAASKVFPSVVLDYFLEKLSASSSEIESDLSKLMKRTLASFAG